MSHYTYKKKRWLETSRGDLLPLAYYADSSLRNQFGGFVWAWCIYRPCEKNILGGGILISKEEFKKAAEEKYTDEINAVGSPDAYTYYGTRYPSGGRVKDMKSFLSTKHTIPIEEYMQDPANHVAIRISANDKVNFKTLYEEKILVYNEETAYKAQEMYEKITKEYPNTWICTGVYGRID